jgi:hypothetical protein
MLKAAGKRRSKQCRFISEIAHHKDVQVVLKKENSLVIMVFQQPVRPLMRGVISLGFQ